MENNRIEVINRKYEKLGTERYSSAEAAYEAYVEAIRVLKANLSVGEEATVIRYRWGKIMAMETVIGTH